MRPSSMRIMRSAIWAISSLWVKLVYGGVDSRKADGGAVRPYGLHVDTFERGRPHLSAAVHIANAAANMSDNIAWIFLFSICFLSR